MTSRGSVEESRARDCAGAVDSVFQTMKQELAQLQETLRLMHQEARRQHEDERQFRESLQRQEEERRVQEAVRLKEQQANRKLLEALHLQEQRLGAGYREMERKLQEKDDIIRALELRRQTRLERLMAAEEGASTSEGSGGEGSLESLEDRVKKMHASLETEMRKLLPLVGALVRRLEEPESLDCFVSLAASSGGAPATGGAAAGGGEEAPARDALPAPSYPSTPTSSASSSSDDGDRDPADEEEQELARRRVEELVEEVKRKMEEAQHTPSPLGEQLLKAVKEERYTEVRRLLDAGADVNYVDENGCTPLFKAVVLKASTEMVSLLLQRGVNVHAVNCNGSSALHWAATTSHSAQCVGLLVEAGGDVNARDVDGETPLHWGAYCRKIEALEALLAAGARKDLKAWCGRWENKTAFAIAQTPQIRDLLQS